MIYFEDCRDTMSNRDIQYDYVLCSPPDYQEVGLDPKVDSYSDFLSTWVDKLNPKNNLVSVCLLYTSPSPRDMRRSRMPSSA